MGSPIGIHRDANAFTIELPIDTTALRAARSVFAQWGLHPERDVIVSELVTNAVLHGSPPVRLHGIRYADRIRVEVSDTRPDMGGPRSESRGLQVVAGLSRAWGVQYRERDKVVWAELE